MPACGVHGNEMRSAPNPESTEDRERQGHSRDKAKGKARRGIPKNNPTARGLFNYPDSAGRMLDLKQAENNAQEEVHFIFVTSFFKNGSFPYRIPGFFPPISSHASQTEETREK
jgi:hypothetical protein